VARLITALEKQNVSQIFIVAPEQVQAVNLELPGRQPILVISYGMSYPVGLGAKYKVRT
jgi:hypothetical protein